CVVLADDAEQQRLNRLFRGKDAPTNVLAFPAWEPGMRSPLGAPLSLGDIVLAFETVAREAAEQGKPFPDHLRHLIVHGVLHLLAPQERVLIGNILKVHDRTAADVMVPRVDIVALDVETSFPEVVKFMVEQGHSRVPVYRETLDNVIGFVHAKDLLGPAAERRETKLSLMLRKVLFVAPSVPILDLLVQMRQARTHIAMVVDEFGGIDGLVTIEDVIEEIVGEIEDEHDVDAPPVLIVRPDGSIIADARIPI